jgi:hypothetical protein
VHDLMPYAKTDLVPLEESSEDELDVVLHAVARWAADHRLDETQVLVDGEQVELPAS